MQQRRVGLFVIDKTTNQTIILKRSVPYIDSLNCDILENGFVEEYCVPRGSIKHNNEVDIQCGIREFIEECQLFFSEFFILPESFELTWQDPPQKVWSYKILFLSVSMEHIFPILPFNVKIVSDKIRNMLTEIKFPVSYLSPSSSLKNHAKIFIKIPDFIIHIAMHNPLNDKNVPMQIQKQILIKNWSALAEHYKLLKPFRKDIKKLHGIQRENIDKIIIDIPSYIYLMIERLQFYFKSNYLDFFNFINYLIFDSYI